MITAANVPFYVKVTHDHVGDQASALSLLSINLTSIAPGDVFYSSICAIRKIIQVYSVMLCT